VNRDVHPVADLFPMLGQDELAELAEDIKQRGLLHPIVLDAEGRVLDGRNRLAACELAGVEPAFVIYDGEDPDGYALAVNIARRHLTKGQQAMVAAMSLDSKDLESSGSKDGSKQAAARVAGVSASRLSQAILVRIHAPELATGVIAGATGLDEAYRVARERKTAADSVEAQLARLRAEDPELADKVVEGELTLPGAWAERRAREAQRESERRTAVANLTSVLTYLVSDSITSAELAERDYVDAVTDFKQDALDYAADTMAAIAEIRRGI
jgi:ParB-like chromosome segregation protein Spo0J